MRVRPIIFENIHKSWSPETAAHLLAILKRISHNLPHSYLLKGHPYDNDRMDSFHSILKRKEVYWKAYQIFTEVQAAIGWTINFYNRNRISNVD